MAQIRLLPNQLAEKAQKELDENPNDIDRHVNELRDWILQQPHLKTPRDDQFLVSFLRGSKYDQAVTRQKINQYFTMRSIVPEFIQMRDIRFGSNAEYWKLGTVLPLPMTDGEDGPRIFLFCPGRYNPKEFNIIDLFKIYILFTDYLLTEDDNFVVSGQIGIIDMTNVTTEHFSQYKPDLMKKMTLLSQNTAPNHWKGFHYINAPNGFDAVFNMLRSFMTKDYQDILYVHSNDLETLYRHISKRLLPTEYGGDAGSKQSIINYWENILLDNHNALIEWEKYGTDELLRPGAPITEETIAATSDLSALFLQ